jgi:hypothetical protein
MTTYHTRTRTGRLTSILSSQDLCELGLSVSSTSRDPVKSKVSDFFVLGTERLPTDVRRKLLEFFHKAYQAQEALRAFLHPDHSPIDDANLVELAHVVETSKATSVDLDKGRAFVRDLIVKYSFRLISFAQEIAERELVMTLPEIREQLHGRHTLEQIRAMPLERLWELQGSRDCIHCASKHLKWKTCLTCHRYTCMHCFVFRDIAFGSRACGCCGVDFN